MALKSSLCNRPAPLSSRAVTAATISSMRNTIADLKAVIDQTRALLEVTRTALAWADDLLGRSPRPPG